jgi:hypothetical protein
MEKYNIFTFLLLLRVLRCHEREKILSNNVVNGEKKLKIMFFLKPNPKPAGFSEPPPVHRFNRFRTVPGGFHVF